MSLIESALVATLIVTYVTMLVILGLTTLFKGRVVLFVIGFVFPVLWIVGAMMPPKLGDDEKWLGAERQRFDDQSILEPFWSFEP
ncbi:MAG: hypothetical protein GY773_16085 [Actinomycetia bacterium]|nr:hypothetical protein [Actinomycetes bacterium]